MVQKTPIPVSSPYQIWVLIFNVLGYSLVVIFQRYLTFHFDTFTMNFYRFLAGSIFLLSLAYIIFREDLKNILKSPSLLKRITRLAFLIAIAQTLIIEGLAHTSATLVGLLGILGIIFSITITSLVFQDERRALQGRMFVLGSMLALIGVIGVILGKENLTLEYSLGSLYVVLAMLIGSSSSVLQKRIISSTHPIASGAVVSVMMCIFYFFPAFFWGDLVKITRISWKMNFMLFGSGIFGLFVGLGLSYISVKFFGVVVHRISRLTTPIFIGIFSYLFLGEQLTAMQMVFGAILLVGCFLAMRKSLLLGSGVK